MLTLDVGRKSLKMPLGDLYICHPTDHPYRIEAEEYDGTAKSQSYHCAIS